MKQTDKFYIIKKAKTTQFWGGTHGRMCWTIDEKRAKKYRDKGYARLAERMHELTDCVLIEFEYKPTGAQEAL